MEISSRNVIEGTARAPNRALYKAMGLSDDDLGKPFVGVCHTGNEATPCNIHLPGLAQKAKNGVKDGGATPREFSTIAVSDGIAMGHEGMKSSLVSREVIADSIELMVRAHQYDALVGIAGCDKSLPGTMMAMARLNIPSIFVYGGTIMPGILDGKELTVVDVYEAVGSYNAGQISLEELKNIEDSNSKFVDQVHSEATYAKKIDKSETKINWNLDAHKVLAHIHGLSPSPGAWFEYENERYKVLKARIMTTKGKSSSVLDENLTVGCKSDSIKILELQRQGKNKQTAKEFLLGKKIIKGSALN